MSGWQNVVIKKNARLEDAISVLANGGKRIALVADDNGNLVGTITDGDVRRGLLAGHSIKTSVLKVMSTTPTVAIFGESDLQILERMKAKDLLHMPVLDESGKLVDLKTVQDLASPNQEKLDNPVLIMAGGFGKRLMPLTKDTPKPMLKIGSRPILEMILEQFIKAGFHRFFISTHYKPEVIKSYFEDGKSWGVSITYINEDVPLGTGGALSLLPDDLPDLPIITMNGDLISTLDFGELLAYHQSLGGKATVCVREYDVTVPFGVVDFEGVNVKSITEKPTSNFFINAGIYVLEREVKDIVSLNQYADMPDVITRLIEKNEVVTLFPLHEFWLDIGRVEHYEKAQDIAEANL